MAAKSSISLVSVQKPTSNTPVLQRRNKLTANLEQQITKIGSFREGKRVSREQFWVDGSAIYFALRYGDVRKVPKDSDVPRQAPNARLIALLLPFWLEGLGDRSCRGEGGT
jgi:hypothetical protein